MVDTNQTTNDFISKIISCEDDKCKICNIESTMSKSWFDFCKDEFTKDYYVTIKKELHNYMFSPKTEFIYKFTAFFEPKDTKIVIVGQDPYKNIQNATGLAFSSAKITSSLRNIYKDIKKSYPEYRMPKNGDLTNWAKQGVLLLNANLTTTNKHGAKNMWIEFTQFIVNKISKCENIVFMLWGNQAQTFEKCIEKNNQVLKSNHPSAKGVREEFGNKDQFKIANAYLIKHKKIPIYW